MDSKLPSRGAQAQRVVVGRGSEKIDDAAERVDAVQRGARAFENLDRVHRLEGNGQVEVVVRGLAVVDAEAVEQDQSLLKAAAAQNDVGLGAAGAALLEKDRGVLTQKIVRGFGGELFAFEGKNLDRSAATRRAVLARRSPGPPWFRAGWNGRAVWESARFAPVRQRGCDGEETAMRNERFERS